MLISQILVVGALMVLCGLAKRRLVFRSATCPVCHHPRPACTCRWL
jgi:hypothetical protein